MTDNTKREMSICSYTVGQLGDQCKNFRCLQDPYGYLKSFYSNPCRILGNPEAKSDDIALVLAIDGETVVGRLGLFSGRLQYEGAVLRIYWLSEFTLHDDYITTGAGAMILLKAFSLGVPLLACGAPSEQLERLYEKLGFQKLAPLKRFVYFYDASVVCKYYLGRTSAVRLLSGLGNSALSLYYAIKRPKSALRLEFRKVQRFDNAIENLFSLEKRNHCVKKADMLNWVLANNISDAFYIYYKDSLVGYCIIKKIQSNGGGSHELPQMTFGTLLDYYIRGLSPKLINDMIRFCIDNSANQGLDLFEFQLCDAELMKACGQFGLRLIGGNRIFFKPPLRQNTIEVREWFLSPGTADAILLGS